MPPNELAEKGAKNWKKKEAQAYLSWFLDIKEERVKYFLAFLDYKPIGKQKIDLTSISELLYNKINDSQFYTLRTIDGGKVLNDYGLSIAADMGLLLAELLQKENPSLYFEIATGPKSYHSYNLPVLKEFLNGEWDLIFTSVLKTGYSLNELKGPYDWASFYNSLKIK